MVKKEEEAPSKRYSHVFVDGLSFGCKNEFRELYS
jgi:hypothetical protein